MRTRNELNKKYERLDTQIEKEHWVGTLAILSLFIVILGIVFSTLFPTFGKYCFVLGFLGMLGFGGRASYLSNQLKELKQEWNSSGYGLKKYPRI